MKIFATLAVGAALFCVGAIKSQQEDQFLAEESERPVKGFNPFGKGTPDRKIVDAIHRYSNRLDEEKGIELKMYALNLNKIHELDDNTIDTIHSAYSLKQHIGYKEARTLFYEIANGFIEHMNAQKDLLQYFYKPPIGYEHLDFKLSFNYGNAGHLEVGEISAVLIRNGKIHYSIVEKESPAQIEFVTTGDPEVFTLGNFCFNTRWVSRQLPETEQDIATEP